jgi:integrase
MSKLNALKIKSITKVGMHSDGGGLLLKVQNSKDGNSLNKSWIYRWGAQGKNSIGLGSLNDFSLAEARERARECRKMVAEGKNPKEERDRDKKALQQAKASSITFKAAAKKYIELNKATWTNEKHAQQWTNTLDAYAYPIIGDIACADITKEHVLKILEPIWTAKGETARRVRTRIERVLGWSIAKGYRTTSNAATFKDNLQPLLPKVNQRQQIKHHNAMHYDEIPNFIASIKDDPSVSARALVFCILTATRTSETTDAIWSEINLKKNIWIIPKDRMKKGIEHRVPLSSQVHARLSIMDNTISKLVFHGQRTTKPISNMTMLNYLKHRDGCKNLTVHGFRSTFRDWAAEKVKFPREVCEQALAHSLKDQTEAAYQRGDYFEKRIELMQAWADYCFGIDNTNKATEVAEKTNKTAPTKKAAKKAAKKTSSKKK